ncbi:MAG: LysM peptidoglycan-binding domain-containing protein, partial [Eubacterium sp.]|nr:LysM peptidoglycan-binding domain-containing protein [Eubacterium sp.]
EALWDIAKKFRTSVDLIKSENELKDDVIDTRRILLIPGM